MTGILWEHSALGFFAVSVLLGGGGAFMIGRACAKRWSHLAIMVIYCVLLSFAVRFLHFALGDGSLLSIRFWLQDAALLIAIAGFGFRLTRADQMASQYFWLYERTGLLSWRPKP